MKSRSSIVAEITCVRRCFGGAKHDFSFAKLNGTHHLHFERLNMSNLDPYKPAEVPVDPADSISDVFSENRFPIHFGRSSKHGLLLAAFILGGGAFLLFGLLMFLLHLFLIPGNNQMALHLSSTMPTIFSIFMLINAYHQFPPNV